MRNYDENEEPEDMGSDYDEMMGNPEPGESDYDDGYSYADD